MTWREATLTDREAAIVHFVREELGRQNLYLHKGDPQKVAERFDIGLQRAKNSVSQIRKKLNAQRKQQQTHEARRPARKVSAKQLREDPVSVVEDVAENAQQEAVRVIVEQLHEAGIGEKKLVRLVEKLGRNAGFTGEVSFDLPAQVTNRSLLDLLDRNAYLALSQLDGAELASASAKDKAIIAGIMLEKRQLLSGEPTQIMGHKLRGAAEEVLTQVAAELKRRGLPVADKEAVDAEFEEVA